MRRFQMLVCGLVVLAFACRASDARSQGVDAVAGEPFGVGVIHVEPDPGFLPPLLGAEGLSVSARDGRILYPVVQTPPDTALFQDLVLDSPWMQGGPLRQRAGGLLKGLLNQPGPTLVYFLFRGDEPLQVTLEGQARREFTLRPRHDPAAHAGLLAAWWRQYSESAGRGLLSFSSKGQYPPCVSNYLQAMLARRLNLPLAASQSGESWQDKLEGQIGFFLGTEEVRLAIARDRMLGRTPSSGQATEALPAPPEWPPLELPEPAADVQIEPIAMRVPAECLYVRFGTFANFLWLQDTLKLWGGDLGNLVALRGLDKGQSRRMEQQLILKQTVLSRLLGPTVISDVAVIGTDMYLREGAAYGILFEARNAYLLDADMKRQRKERLALGGVSEKTVKIAGRNVSLIASPDGSVRSFYVADKGYLLVTTSEALVRRFLETAGDGPSLGREADFRHARTVMPLSREDTIFVYLSDAFFRNMAGPRYWIESYRRLQAVADMQLVEMATLASATEGKPGDTTEELMAGGFLPAEFGPRPDGSRTLLANGDAVDSLRGRRGFFTPIPDVPVAAVAPEESAAYRHFVDFCRAEWGRFDPVMVGIRRYPAKDHVERVVLDAQANPLARRHFELLSGRIGPPNEDRLAPIPGDRVAMDVQLTGQRLFGGIRDQGTLPPPGAESTRLLGNWRNLLVGYVGTTGELGFLGLLDRRFNAPSDSPGLLGRQRRLWREESEPFTVFSFHPNVLAEVIPQLRFVPAERPAQIRLHVGDISQGRLTSSLTTMSYYRTRCTTLGNLRLMHSMSEQLHVPRHDAKEVAELLLDARLVCPLGGNYEYRERTDGSGYWTSTALENEPDGPLAGRVPEGFTAPPMSWFRGLDADVAMTSGKLTAHAEVLMRLPDKPVVAEPEPLPQPEEVPAPPSVEQPETAEPEPAPAVAVPADEPSGAEPAPKPDGAEATKAEKRPAKSRPWLKGLFQSDGK